MFLEQIASRRIELALASGGSPKKAKIKKIYPKPKLFEKKEIEVSFNPEKIEYEYCVEQNEVPDPGMKIGGHRMHYGGTLASKLKMDLLFDTTMTGSSVYDKYIKFLVDLVEPVPDKKPAQTPTCQFHWGSFTKGRNAFDAVVEYLNIDYVWFLPNGTPVRAKTTIRFKQLVPQSQGTNPTSRSEARRVWRVVEGQTLDWIAFQEYGDSSAWRHIAQVNNLRNPRDLRPGMLLMLLPLP